MRRGTKAESRSPTRGLVCFYSFAPAPSLTRRCSSLFFILFTRRFSSGLFFGRRSGIGGTMVRESPSSNFFSPAHWQFVVPGPPLEALYVTWRQPRRWRPNRPNLPLFPARDQNTGFSKGRVPPFLLPAPSCCATLRDSEFLPSNCSRMRARRRSTWNGFSWNRNGQFTNTVRSSLFRDCCSSCAMAWERH